MVATPTDAIKSFREGLALRMATQKHTRARVAAVPALIVSLRRNPDRLRLIYASHPARSPQFDRENQPVRLMQACCPGDHGGVVKKQFEVKPVEYAELAGAIDQLASRAPSIDAGELIALWPWVEGLVLDRVRADEFETQSGGAFDGALLRAEGQRIRNLAWEIGVSVDLGAVHVNALEALAELLHKRGARFSTQAARRRLVERGGADASPAAAHRLQ